MLMDLNNAAHTRTLSYYTLDEYTLKELSQVFEYDLHALFIVQQKFLECIVSSINKNEMKTP